MKTEDFFYELPKELIAQTPIKDRASSKMMVLNRKTGELHHKNFYDILNELMPQDCLILNDSKVLPARIYGIKKSTGSKVEFLILNQIEENIWEALAGPGKKAKPSDEFVFKDGLLNLTVLDITKDGNRIVEFKCSGNFYQILDKIGEMPLPHYITEKLADKNRYQTVYANDPGSAAAPTAGLHFTKSLLENIKQKGISIGYVTLHVGLGTFRPVQTEFIEDHKMHCEHFSITKETADIINKTKKSGGRVFAVGTTTCRTLESVFFKEGQIKETHGSTDIFIYPGYEFKVIDALITNFHLPESSLIMLVSAFAGYENTMNAYKIAVKEKYRFFSFGDSMLIK